MAEIIPMIPTMKGRLGTLIDRINNKLQVVVVYTEGTPAEKAGLEIADYLREVYKIVKAVEITKS